MKVLFSEDTLSDFRHKNSRLISDQLYHMLSTPNLSYFLSPETYIQNLTALQLLQVVHISSQSSHNYLSRNRIKHYSGSLLCTF